MLNHPCDPNRLLARIRSGAKRAAILATLDEWLADVAPKMPGLVVELVESDLLPAVAVAVRMRSGQDFAQADISQAVERKRSAEFRGPLFDLLDQVHWRLVLQARKSARRKAVARG